MSVSSSWLIRLPKLPDLLNVFMLPILPVLPIKLPLEIVEGLLKICSRGFLTKIELAIDCDISILWYTSENRLYCMFYSLYFWIGLLPLLLLSGTGNDWIGIGLGCFWNEGAILGVDSLVSVVGINSAVLRGDFTLDRSWKISAFRISAKSDESLEKSISLLSITDILYSISEILEIFALFMTYLGF